MRSSFNAGLVIGAKLFCQVVNFCCCSAVQPLTKGAVMASKVTNVDGDDGILIDPSISGVVVVPFKIIGVGSMGSSS